MLGVVLLKWKKKCVARRAPVAVLQGGEKSGVLTQPILNSIPGYLARYRPVVGLKVIGDTQKHVNRLMRLKRPSSMYLKSVTDHPAADIAPANLPCQTQRPRKNQSKNNAISENHLI